MIHRTRTLAAIALALGLAMPSPAQWSGGYGAFKPDKPIALGTGAPVSADLFKRNRSDDIHGARRIVIPFFQIQFVTGSKVSSTRSFANLSQNYQLAGLGEADMQAIADRLYARFVADLTARGFSVVPLDQARGQSPALAKLLAAAKPAPYRGSTNDGTISTIVTAGATPIYFHVGDPRMGSMANIGSRAYWDQPAAATELDAALVGVRIGVDFVEQSSSDKRGLLGIRSGTAKLSSEVSLSIEPLTTHLWIQAPGKTPKIVGQPIEPVRRYLTSPLLLAGDAVIETEDSTTRGAKRSDAAASAVGMLLGGGFVRNRTKSYTVTVDPARFQAEVGGAMASVEAAMAEQIAADLLK